MRQPLPPPQVIMVMTPTHPPFPHKRWILPHASPSLPTLSVFYRQHVPPMLLWFHIFHLTCIVPISHMAKSLVHRRATDHSFVIPHPHFNYHYPSLPSKCTTFSISFFMPWMGKIIGIIVRSALLSVFIATLAGLRDRMVYLETCFPAMWFLANGHRFFCFVSPRQQWNVLKCMSKHSPIHNNYTLWVRSMWEFACGIAGRSFRSVIFPGELLWTVCRPVRVP